MNGGEVALIYIFVPLPQTPGSSLVTKVHAATPASLDVDSNRFKVMVYYCPGLAIL
jgi:hypothetical protein